ncbi:hypothetical protein GBAR_LOCUS29769 [Geodia barretti]|uniref:Uncharacterized protein n=1 Tax=Geodia barretti TaxID=519541 RepID=A0AA35TUA8_GEOBA|nr:hypothetical protein GBAR_LOCUS29769 [Geodia barretti]
MVFTGTTYDHSHQSYGHCLSSQSNVHICERAESTAVIAGGVGGGIILCQILVIAIFCICNRSTYSKKVETHSNTAYGVVPAIRREEPEYEVINQPLKQTAVKLPLSRNVATASTVM